MKYSIGTNFDNALVARVTSLGGNEHIEEFYGAVSAAPLGGGTSHGLLPDHTRLEAVAAHVRLIVEQGFSFAYVFNAVSYDNKEFSTGVWQELRQFLIFLRDAGVTTLVLANPYLIEKVRHHLPEFRIRASVLFGADTLQKVAFLEELGIDGIVLDDQVNRDFELLQMIRDGFSGEITLLANQNCLFGCPYRYVHKSFIAHCGQNAAAEEIDYSYLLCSLKKVEQPHLLLAGRWIRPEDQHVYEELGIDRLKLGMRSYPTGKIVQAVKAYLDQRYEGNLLDILFGNYAHALHVPEEVLQRRGFADLLPHCELSISPDECNKRYVQFNLQEYFLFVDNIRLETFLNRFRGRRCSSSRCDSCSSCLTAGREAVSVTDEPLRQRYLAMLQEIRRVVLEK